MQKESVKINHTSEEIIFFTENTMVGSFFAIYIKILLFRQNSGNFNIF